MFAPVPERSPWCAKGPNSRGGILTRRATALFSDSSVEIILGPHTPPTADPGLRCLTKGFDAVKGNVVATDGCSLSRWCAEGLHAVPPPVPLPIYKVVQARVVM